MARPKKTGLDYFPHDCDAISDEKVDALRALHGNDGYVFFFYLLERIFRAEGDFVISSPKTHQILARKLLVSDEKFKDMLETAFEFNLFDRDEYEKSGKLTSNGVINRIKAVTEKREERRGKYRKPVCEDSSDEQNEFLEGLCVTNSPETPPNGGLCVTNSPETRQSKVKERKVKESKDQKPLPPTPKTEPSPILPDCEFFRATESELETAKRTWVSAGKPAEDFSLAIAQVEFWLGGKTPEAVKARSHFSHARQLHATWVLGKVNDELEERERTQQRIAGKPVRGNSNAPPQTGYKTAAERKTELFDKLRREARGEAAASGENVIDVTPRSL